MPIPGHRLRRRNALLVSLVGLGLALCLLTGALASARAAEAGHPRRIVSLNPSLTAMLIALGAGDRLVGVDDYSARLHPELDRLPKVGGLFTPSLEGVAALSPDLVVLVRGVEQRDFEERLDALGIASKAFANITLEEVLGNLEQLGALTGNERAAAARIGEIRSTLDAAAARSEHWPVLRVLVVLQREPLYVVGSGTFISEMLAVMKADNVADALGEPYPRVAMEWAIAQAPEVVIDLARDPQPPEEFWSRWPSLPAVQGGRVLDLDPELISMPGPELDRAVIALVDGLRGPAEAERVRARAARAHESAAPDCPSGACASSTSPGAGGGR